jgi:predicted ATPase
MDGTVANARLVSLTLERFKSYESETTIELSPLTVILGRNNSGKSSIIQALLLLKQTLALPRPDVPLHLEGFVEALNLREITYGWPAQGPEVAGPKIGVRWSSRVDVAEALQEARYPEMTSLVNSTGLKWLLDIHEPKSVELVTDLQLTFSENDGRIVLKEVQLWSLPHGGDSSAEIWINARRQSDGTYACFFRDEGASKLGVELDHFVPYLLINRRNVGPRDRQRSWHNAFLVLFAQPLEDLKSLLTGFAYLGSVRTLPPTLYRPATVAPEDIGVSGEYAAQMLHARREDRVHYLPPLRVEQDEVLVPDIVRSRNLVEAVNDVLGSLGVDSALKIDDIKDVGFRLLFGQASLQHVGRGLSYVLPVIQLGLIADPLRFQPALQDTTLEEYEKACPYFAHCAFEEPEAHLHPKVQTRLAHWLVALAMAHRQILVETHSDHLVRRLRGLAARAKPGSLAEAWLLANVRVLQIDQQDGRSIVKSATLTPQGGLEDWPADFMDEATDEERSIYDASLDKPPSAERSTFETHAIEHDQGEEPDDAS